MVATADGIQQKKARATASMSQILPLAVSRMVEAVVEAEAQSMLRPPSVLLKSILARPLSAAAAPAAAADAAAVRAVAAPTILAPFAAAF